MTLILGIGLALRTTNGGLGLRYRELTRQPLNAMLKSPNINNNNLHFSYSVIITFEQNMAALPMACFVFPVFLCALKW